MLKSKEVDATALFYSRATGGRLSASPLLLCTAQRIATTLQLTYLN